MNKYKIEETITPGGKTWYFVKERLWGFMPFWVRTKIPVASHVRLPQYLSEFPYEYWERKYSHVVEFDPHYYYSSREDAENAIKSLSEKKVIAVYRDHAIKKTLDTEPYYYSLDYKLESSIYPICCKDINECFRIIDNIMELKEKYD